MPLKLYLILIGTVLLAAALTLWIASMIFDDVNGPGIGAVSAVVVIGLALAARYLRENPNDPK